MKRQGIELNLEGYSGGIRDALEKIVWLFNGVKIREFPI
jgi:hypothetical protein